MALTVAPPDQPTERPPLLPDRSDIVGLDGRVERNAAGGIVFVPARRYLGTIERRVILLPSPMLSDLQASVGTANSDVAWIRLTGIVTTYRGENYLLPTFAVRLPHAPVAVANTPVVPPGGNPPIEVPRFTAPTAGAASDAASAVPTASAAPVPSPPENAAAAAEGALDAALGEGASAPEDVARRLEQGLDARVGDVPRSVAADGADHAAAPILVRSLQRRRCSIERDAATGAWYALGFDDDARGERRWNLLQCARLESIESAARIAEPGKPVLLTGAAFEAQGQWWVLPDRVEAVTTGKGIKP